jgi:hypothetical protein
MEPFELVVVGSDEVWNLSHPWYGACALFFGDGIRARQLISYAASFGSHPVVQELEPWWAERLRRFDAISVRDETSRRVIQRALGVDPELVLDPCLQFADSVDTSGSDSAAECSETSDRRPFVAVYGHTFSRPFSLEVRRWARSRGYRLVSVGYRNDWADDQRIAAGPQEFARTVARAEALATNFFHGCVFALRDAKPFVCEMSPYRTSKIRDLLTMVAAGRHLVSPVAASAAYDSCLNEPVEQVVLRRIAGFRRSADAYLNAVLT